MGRQGFHVLQLNKNFLKNYIMQLSHKIFFDCMKDDMSDVVRFCRIHRQTPALYYPTGSHLSNLSYVTKEKGNSRQQGTILTSMK